jgi:hypothetical protein
MSKDTDVSDLLGEAPAKKTAPKKAAATKAEAPAKPAKKAAATKDEAPAKPAKKAAATKDEAPAKAKRVREAIVFEEGEVDELIKRVKQLIKKNPQNSKDIAERLEIPTRKLRQVLYRMSRQGIATLELAGAKAQGMTVTAAA